MPIRISVKTLKTSQQFHYRTIYKILNQSDKRDMFLHMKTRLWLICFRIQILLIMTWYFRYHSDVISVRLRPSFVNDNECKISYHCLEWDLSIWLKRLKIVQLRNRSALAVNCWVTIHCLEVSCKGDQITSAKREWLTCLQMTDKQWIITQYSTFHTLELIYFDSNTQETMKKQLHPSNSFNFPPLHWRNPAKKLTVTQAFTCISYGL